MQESVVPVKDDVAVVVVQKQSPGWAPIQEPELCWRSLFPVHQCAEEDAAVARSGGSTVHSQLDSKGTRIPPAAGQIIVRFSWSFELQNCCPPLTKPYLTCTLDELDAQQANQDSIAPDQSEQRHTKGAVP